MIRSLFLVILLSLPTAIAPRARAQTSGDALEVVRSLLRADRDRTVAEAMQLQEGESEVFWPIYREYRAEVGKVGDGLVKLVLEYADAYPDALEETRAATMVKEFVRLEQDLARLKKRFAARFAKVLPSSKVLRLLQVENRLDLILRLQLANSIPLVPAGGTATPLP